MLYEIGHVLRYDYGALVTLAPHVFRLVPRSGGYQRLVEFRWDIRPAPAQSARNRDAEGNDVLQAWFVGPVRSLTVRLKSLVETLRTNPFDFIPAAESSEDSAALAPFRTAPPPDPALDAFVASLRAEVREAADFPGAVCRRLQALFTRERREAGAPRSPVESWMLKRGACRDLAVLFMDLCRRAGLAARFVSGYVDDEGASNRRDLHAWAEVYVPGGGWRGYDPTTGLAVADRHVAVATGVRPASAAPVAGVYGGAADARFRYAATMARVR